MILRNEGLIEKINSEIPAYLNQFGISDQQNEKVFKKSIWLSIKENKIDEGLYSD